MELKAVEEIALANVGVFAICASMDALCLRGPSRLQVPACMLCDSSALVTWSCRHRRHRRGDSGGSGSGSGNGSGILLLVGVVVVVVAVVVRALYVFDDPLFWLSRNWTSKKTLQNAVLRKGANLKKGQSPESGFSGFSRNIMMARHKITVPRSVSGSACFFQNMPFRHNRTRQRSRKYCKTRHFCNKAILPKIGFEI